MLVEPPLEKNAPAATAHTPLFQPRYKSAEVPYTICLKGCWFMITLYMIMYEVSQNNLSYLPPTDKYLSDSAIIVI